MGEKIDGYEKLVVYQESYKLVLKVYEITRKLPEQERREIGYQVRRASVSIPANIAEGYGRKNSKAEFKHFLRNALGSSNEVVVLLKLIADLGYAKTSEEAKQYELLGKRIYRLIEVWK